MSRRDSQYIPILVAISVVVGILIGSFYANHFSGDRLSIINSSSNKLNDLLHIIDDKYVDAVNIDSLVEKALPGILKELDPHSVYVSAKDVEADMQDLKGSFSGIGVQFTINHDTICVINVVPNGPAEDVGVEAGDRIVSVDGKPFVGKKVTQDLAMSTLKGAKGTKIRLGVRRNGTRKPLFFNIIRGDVPVKSIDASYMLDNRVGYIRINSFGDTTYPELLSALAQLNHEGMRNLVIDLRGNRGGFMAPAVQMANEFLSKNKLIVYTKGRKSPRSEFRSDGRGTYQTIPLIVLVDQYSASASEIFAGAIQDNDRGTIVGVRTFGKGLVQTPIQFFDGSMLRITVARYYTPAGRCLQKPYVMGDEEDYEMDIFRRAEHGEFFSRDSIHLSGEKYRTSIGRIVYGGGGIMPDVFVPHDSIGYTSYFLKAGTSALLARFAFEYVDHNRAKLKTMNGWKSVVKYLKTQRIPDQFAVFGDKNGLPRRNLMLHRSYTLFEHYLFSYILQDIYDTSAGVQYTNTYDPYIMRTLEIFKAGKAFPSRPVAVRSNVVRRR